MGGTNEPLVKGQGGGQCVWEIQRYIKAVVMKKPVSFHSWLT
jgi:hypothetical protein